MNVLLVTTTNNLAEKFAALSPELEYCAIVVDDVEPAKEILLQVGLYQDLLCPMEELKNCVDALKYDYALCVQDKPYDGKINVFKNYDVSNEKIISFAALPGSSNFQTERPLRYQKILSKRIVTFATGTSYTETAIDIRQFSRRTINFGTSSQDLYYSFQIAKAAISCGGNKNALRHALIGLAPYSFHFDLSRAFTLRCRLLPWFIAFNDLHNFFIPADVYKKFLREEWLTKKFTVEKLPINGVKSKKVMTDPLNNKSGIRPWAGKYYPATRDENVKILDDYLTLCEENNVRPIMFMAPLTEKYMESFNKQLLEEFYDLVEQARQKHLTACFVDGSNWGGVTYADFYDHQHMNLYGAAKFSAYLNDFIEQLKR